MGILVDTGVFVAFLNTRDPHHEAAGRILRAAGRQTWGVPMVTDLVVAELLTLVRRRLPARAEARALRFFPPDPLVPGLRIVHTTAGLFQEVMEGFARYRDQGLSFTDLHQVVLAEELGVYRIATFDKGFEGLVERVEDGPSDT